MQEPKQRPIENQSKHAGELHSCTCTGNPLVKEGKQSEPNSLPKLMSLQENRPALDRKKVKKRKKRRKDKTKNIHKQGVVEVPPIQAPFNCINSTSLFSSLHALCVFVHISMTPGALRNASAQASTSTLWCMAILL